MTSRDCSTLLLAFIATLALFCRCCSALEHGTVDTLDSTCQKQLTDLYQQHYGQQTILPDQVNCTEVIDSALASQDGLSCPDDTILKYCFALATDAWVAFIDACEPFSPPPNCLPTANTAALTGSDCKRPQNPTGWYVSSGSIVSTTSMYAFGTGVVPNAGPDWETIQPEGRRLSRRMLASSGEGEGGGAGQDAGCFPDFYDSTDFQNWLDGTYQEPTFGGNNINPIGIIFWVLHGIGIVSLAAF